MKRIYINDNSYFIIADNDNIVDDIRNPSSNIYVEINGSIYAFYKKSTDKLIETIDYSDILNENGVAYVSQDAFTDIIENATAGSSLTSPLDVVIQSSTSPIYVVKFSQIVNETTLTITTAKNDYIINVASNVGFVVGQYLTIYNVAFNRVFFSEILEINTLAITLDRPLDFEFPSGSIVTIGETNMNVDGSATSQIFGVRNPTIEDVPLEIDISRIMFSLLTLSEPQLSDFGDIANGLLRGIQIRRVDGTYQNLVNFKTNMEMKEAMFDLEIQTVSKNAQDGITARFTFEKLGQVVRIGAGEDLQIVIQDDLTTLTSFTILAEGSEVTD